MLATALRAFARVGKTLTMYVPTRPSPTPIRELVQKLKPATCAAIHIVMTSAIIKNTSIKRCQNDPIGWCVSNFQVTFVVPSKFLCTPALTYRFLYFGERQMQRIIRLKMNRTTHPPRKMPILNSAQGNLSNKLSLANSTTIRETSLKTDILEKEKNQQSYIDVFFSFSQIKTSI